jgi:ubiquinone/menaquinone biosynthesis C-methylase UbiE
MDRSSIISNTNREVYSTAEVVDWYSSLDLEVIPERVVLERLTPFLRTQRVLDIGVGGGRSTKILRALVDNYTGIDYSPHFIKKVQEKFPGTEFHCLDARDLSVFDDCRFGFVMFSLNGIDYVAHDDRIRILKEIYRVLKPGGFFFFSSHNRNYKPSRVLTLGRLKESLHNLWYLPRHLGMKKFEFQTEDYAILNDNAHRFSLLTYHMTIARQLNQLEQVGFVDSEAYDKDGHVVTTDASSPWIHYLTRKPQP